MISVVAMECGGTQTRAALYDGAGACLAQTTGPAANPTDLGVSVVTNRVVELFDVLTRDSDVAPTAIAVAAAGAGTDDYAERIAASLVARLDVDRAIVSDDLTPILLKNLKSVPGVFVISGTGSSVLAQGEDGAVVQVGGRGALFGDPGSGYQIAVQALRAAVDAIDGLAPPTSLVDLLPQAARLESFEGFVAWNRGASKSGIANLATVVNDAAERGDDVAYSCIEAQADALAEQVKAAASGAHLRLPSVVLVRGGVVENSKLFRARFEERIHTRWPGVAIREPALVGPEAVARFVWANDFPRTVAVAERGSSPDFATTESRNAESTPLDRLSTLEAVEAMAAEDRAAADASRAAAPQVAALIEAATAVFESGGRIVYIGAGTSGRLGVLDASECHPTFGVAEDRVVGVIAGGETALRHSIEGAEDDTAQCLDDLAALDPRFGERDMLVGIAASGTTPYVRAALDHWRSLRARTALISCNPVRDDAADFVVCLETGAERLPGSTRLKAGTATKMVLNQLTTIILAHAGYVYDGYMVGVTPTNDKLQLRAQRILSALTGIDPNEAAQLLSEAEHRIPVAVLMHRHDLTRDVAATRLAEAGGSLRRALDDR